MTKGDVLLVIGAVHAYECDSSGKALGSLSTKYFHEGETLIVLISRPFRTVFLDNTGRTWYNVYEGASSDIRKNVMNLSVGHEREW